jgi:hypothetical protein
VAGILRQNPQTRPNWTKKSPAPAFHAVPGKCRGSATQILQSADADRFMIDVKKVLEEDTWTELEAYV